VSPASSPGSVDITLTNAAGQSVAVSADRFTFTPPPTLSSVTPNTGTVAGGASVTVKGLNFLLGKTTFKFGTADVVAATGGYFGDAPPYQGHVALIDRTSGRLRTVYNTVEATLTVAAGGSFAGVAEC
jgi:hypothetical protein